MSPLLYTVSTLIVPTPGRVPGLKQNVNLDVHSKQIPSTRPHPGLQQHVNPEVHSKQIPSTRPHPSLQH